MNRNRKLAGIFRRYCRGIMAALICAILLLYGGIAAAGVSSLHPGAGNKPAKTPEWNVEQQKEKDTFNTKDTSVKKLETKTNLASSLDVMLGDGLATAVLSADTEYEIVDTKGKVLKTLSANRVANMSIKDNKLALNGDKLSSNTIILQGKNGNTQTRVIYNSNGYHGTLRVVFDGKALLVVNNVSLEDYVKGVLPSEMSVTWPSEALKAQAVAARTFALYSKGKQHGASSGYDLCSATHCQVYEGVAGEDDAANAAVEATKGQVILYNSQPIYAAFHASSGGATENSEEVWGNYLPYLRSVTDDDSQSPYHNWTVKFTAAQVQKKLSSASKGVGTLKSIAMKQSSSTSESVTGRTASGRPYGVVFTGSDATVTLTCEQVRSIFGLKSAMFNISAQRTASPSDSSSKKNSSSGTFNDSPSAMKNSAVQLKGTETIIFDGHGFGHGLGLAQYGAKAMADAGSKYTDILHHYYTDINIYTIY